MSVSCGVSKCSDAVGFRQSDLGGVVLEDNEFLRATRHLSAAIEGTSHGGILSSCGRR